MKNIRFNRLYLGIKQKDMAKDLGLSPAKLCKIENDKVRLSEEDAENISTYFYNKFMYIGKLDKMKDIIKENKWSWSLSIYISLPVLIITILTLLLIFGD